MSKFPVEGSDVLPVGIVPHGTLEYAELQALGLEPGDVDVFSSNINPYGPPPAVVHAVQAVIERGEIAQYPDRHCTELRSALAIHYSIAADEILVGNGTADLLWLIALIFMRQKRVAILSPTFGEYANVAALVDATVDAVCLPGWEAGTDGRYAPGRTTLDDCVHAVERRRPEVVFLCNPNNPTGEHLTVEDVRRLYHAAPDALWILDEAYAPFAPAAWSATRSLREGNVLVLHSMTKDFALAGLRLGYVTGPVALIERMRVAQPPWNVNVAAQAAGMAALESMAWRDESVARLRQETEELREALRASGFDPRPTTTNYILVPVTDAGEVRARLLVDRILVRDCTSFGLPGFVRIATQKPDANRRLLAAMSRLRKFAG